ncbi:MAG: hypothetical protein JNK61_04755 [Bacteroidia bacterium]|nr:hypothetical protein [Bacteroidia bacterium]HQU99777.1 hypothetical protein [Bacteroidia bacterium]
MTLINNRFALLVCAILSSFFLIASCDEDDKCNAGTGGNVVLVTKPQHHGKAIISQAAYLDSAFIKFNTKEFPGANASLYDLVVAGEIGEDHVHISGLKCGDYYIYMSGWDTTINQRVTGGLPYSFSQESGEINLVVPVTE